MRILCVHRWGIPQEFVDLNEKGKLRNFWKSECRLCGEWWDREGKEPEVVIGKVVE